MVTKSLVIVLLLAILYTLGSALAALLKTDGGDSTRMVKALTWRIALSLLLFTILIVAYANGWIQPHLLSK